MPAPHPLEGAERVAGSAAHSIRWWRHPHLAHRSHRIACPVGAHELEDSGGIEPVSRANQAATCQDFPFKTKLLVLAKQTGKLLALGGGQPVLATTLVQIGLFDPISDGLRGGLELAGQLQWGRGMCQ